MKQSNCYKIINKKKYFVINIFLFLFIFFYILIFFKNRFILIKFFFPFLFSFKKNKIFYISKKNRLNIYINLNTWIKFD